MIELSSKVMGIVSASGQDVDAHYFDYRRLGRECGCGPKTTMQVALYRMLRGVSPEHEIGLNVHTLTNQRILSEVCNDFGLSLSDAVYDPAPREMPAGDRGAASIAITFNIPSGYEAFQETETVGLCSKTTVIVRPLDIAAGAESPEALRESAKRIVAGIIAEDQS